MHSQKDCNMEGFRAVYVFTVIAIPTHCYWLSELDGILSSKRQICLFFFQFIIPILRCLLWVSLCYILILWSIFPIHSSVPSSLPFIIQSNVLFLFVKTIISPWLYIAFIPCSIIHCIATVWFFFYSLINNCKYACTILSVPIILHKDQLISLYRYIRQNCILNTFHTFCTNLLISLPIYLPSVTNRAWCI